jgi:DNA-binding transcriptional MerR regulator
MREQKLMKEWTLMEITNEFGIPRRAIQGYEILGLVKSTGKTLRGYLLYDENAVKRIREIKVYQKLGFQLKQIKEIIDSSQEVKKIALCGKREELIQKSGDLSELVDQVKSMIEEL